MSFVALRMLIGDRLKYFALVAGLAFAGLLVTQQSSIFTGYASRMGVWIRETAQNDLWVMDPQVQYSDDIKPITDTMLYRVRGVEGVQWAVPMYKGFLPARLPDGAVTTVRVVGLDDSTLMGGPARMLEGTLADLRQDRAMIVHVRQAADGLSLKTGMPGEGPRALRVGDEVSINDNSLRVTGVFDASDEFFWDPIVYTTYSRALSIAPRTRKLSTFVLVKTAPGADVKEVARKIEVSTGMRAMTPRQFDRLTMWFLLTRTGILINFGITVALGVVIGVLASAQTFFSFVVENTRYFATIKAMGGSDWTIARMILLQVVVVGGVGYGIGLGLAAITGELFEGGGLAFRMPWQIPVLGALSVLGCCMFAGMISAYRVFRLQPAAVFKA